MKALAPRAPFPGSPGGWELEENPGTEKEAGTRGNVQRPGAGQRETHRERQKEMEGARKKKKEKMEGAKKRDGESDRGEQTQVDIIGRHPEGLK